MEMVNVMVIDVSERGHGAVVGILAVALLVVTIACVSYAAGRGEVVKTEPETTEETQVIEDIGNTSLTRESDEKVAGRSRDVAVIASRDSVAISVETVRRILDARGFGDVKLLVEGADDAEDGREAADDSSALEMVGWWVDGHDRVWALHFVSEGVFASRLWMDESEPTNMLVCESDRVTMYNADLGRLVRVGTEELESEGVQVVRVERLDAESLGAVEVSS